MSDPENQGTENPYAAPSAATGGGAARQRPSGVWVRQVRIVAILMCVQGALEFLFGLYFVAMGFLFPSMMAMQQQPNQISPQQAAFVTDIMFTFFVIGGGVVTLLGVLRFTAGILGFNFRSRGLGVASHFLGLLSLFSFYCIITGLPLCIYGCLIYFNPEVKTAFQMRGEGQSVDEILAQFH